ncbi:MAG: T9SS type A sorting domain-containing protein [Bacteroidetes bacterium]|nr:T9SS type A sorting domain-containing protein [Bacteroidota bacterium]
MTLKTQVSRVPTSAVYLWFKDNVAIPSSNFPTLTVDESGSYHCLITGTTGSCDGTSNSIDVNVKLFPFTSILLDCTASPTYNIFAAPIIGTTPLTNGPGGITYSWSSGETSDRISATSTGWYYVTVTAPNGCSKTNNVYYTADGDGPTVTATILQQSSGCLNNGKVRVTIPGGPGGDVIHVSISNGVVTEYLDWTITGVHELDNLAPGNYTIFVTIGGGNCFTSVPFTIGTVSSTLSANFISNNVSCRDGQNGTIELTSVSGNASNVSIEIPSIGYINNNIPNSAYPLTISTNLAAGIYLVKVIDLFNCSFIIETITIDQPDEIDIEFTEVNVTGCHNSSNGSVVATASNGNSPYTYVWDVVPTVSVQSLTSVGFGTYNVTVTDNDGCTATDFVNISAPADLTVSSVVLSDATCTYNDGSAEVIVSGGTLPYSYSWSSGGTGSIETGLIAGTYTCNVISSSCTTSVSVTISEISSGLSASSIVSSPIACFGGTASVDVSATSGTFPYSGTGTFSTSVGTFTATVTDASGCTATTSVLVNQPAQLQVSLSQSATGCFGGNGNEITSNVSGGTGPFTYIWTPGNATTPVISNLVPGAYSVKVTDANGCTITNSITISSDPNCCFASGGDIIFSDGPLTLASYTGTRSLNFNAVIQAPNSNVTFTALDLVIGAGNSITVQSGCTLNIYTGSNLHACANMWNGIINNGGTIIIQDSRIEDALEAVLMNKGNLQLDNGTFDHNFIGIHFLTGAYDQSTTWIRSSTFDCTTGQISKLPHVGELTSSHIVVENVSGLVMGTGIGQGFLNNIRNAKIGLNIVSSDIEVYNNNFEVLPYTFNYPIKCTAISASGTSGNFLQSIRIGSPAVPNNNSISNWRIGISANKIIGLNIDNNSISSNYAGIYVARCSNLKINNNMIRQFRTGIHCYDNSGNIEINTNYFNYPITPDVIKNTAIRVENPSSNSIDLRIESNWIFNATTGILCRNVPKAIVGKRNRIYFFADNSTLTTLGFNEAISLENCNDSYVLLNEVYRYIDPDPSMPEIMRGISIDKTTNAYVYGNNLRKMGQGIKFGGQCDYTQLHCNVMLDNFNGVFLDNSSQSDQGVPTESWDNYWNNQVDPSWYRVWGDNPLNGINWYYDASIDNNYNPNPHIANFINDIDLTPHGSCPDPTLVQISNNIEEDLKDIAYDLIQYSDFNGEMKYENKEFFYEKIKENPSLLNRGLPEDQVFQQLYNSLRTGNIGAFDDVKDFVKNSDFAQAYLKNLTIVHQNTIEENKKIVNEIYLHCEMNDTLPDSLQISLLENIAFQYPSSGGEAVYWARAILHLDIEDNMISLRKRNPIVKGEEGFGKLYPNPASETVIYEYPLKQEEKGVFEIYDQLNKMIFASEILTTYHSIKTSGFKNGVYNCRFIIDGKIVDYQKLVIVK